MIISCIGDSLTEGDYGVFGKTGIANVKSENYPYFLSRIMNCEVRNFGKCGYRASTMLAWYKAGNADISGSDIVLVMLGTNGGMSAEGNSDENRAYMELISLVRAKLPDAHIILITPPNATVNPFYSNCGYMPQVLEAQGFTKRAAKELGLRLIDITRVFTPERESLYQPNDGLHFGRTGYMRLAHVIYNSIVRMRTAPYSTIRTDCTAKLVAHRGLSGIESENTAASFTAAANRACYWGIETDIWFTKDNVPVCSHDNHTGRMCSKDMIIPDTEFSELRKLQLFDVDGVTPCGQYILPTLDEYVRICKKYSKHSVAELKADFTSEQIKTIIDVFRKYDHLDNTTFIAFNIANLDLVRSYLPEQSCQYLTSVPNYTDTWYTELADMLKKRHMDLDTDYYPITKEAVEHFHSHGIKVNVWTVDSPDCAQYLSECGVDYITTNILEQR